MDRWVNYMEILKSINVYSYIIAGVVLVTSILLSSLFAKIIMAIFKIKPEESEKKPKAYRTVKNIWILVGLYFSILILELPENWIAIATKGFKLFMIIGITKLVAQLVRPNIKLFEKFKDGNEAKNESTIKFGIKFVRGIVYIIGAFIFISELGYDLSGLVTGLGIGSVVVALAAQDLAKNLFGGFAILTDKTFVIGDNIEVKGTYGTVEDISFRTTRIRKLDDTIVTMPNSVLADSEIINWSKLNKRRYDCSLKIGLNVKQSDIDDIIKKLGFEFQKNTNIIKDSFRIYFSGIEQDGYKISIYMYTKSTSYDEYIEFIDEVNDSIVELLEKERVKLVYPTYQIIQK